MILCCGEALIDMIPTDTGAFMPHVGGSVFNTAIALGRLGINTGFLSGISSDHFGQMLCDALQDSDVATDHLIRSERLTTLAMVHLINGSATYSFYDENSAGRMIAPADLPPVPDDVSTLYFGGISLAAEPAADAYATLLQRERKNRLVMIDPNIRPNFIADETRFRKRLKRMFALADIIKTSDEDLDWLVPEKKTIEQQALDLLAQGPAVIVVTRGESGATVFTKTGTASVSAPKVEVVDSVGAGDTFNAGFLASLYESNTLTRDAVRAASASDLSSALRLGAQVAALTVSRAGANPPWRAELA